jgi:transcriptional regulator with XRE-family HTH domain
MTHQLDQPERDAVLRAFGQRLRSLRADAGLSQVDLAARCFLRNDHISAFERGVRLPTLMVLLVLGDALGEPACRLVDGLPPPTRRAATLLALALIESRPGISAAQLADALEVSELYVLELTCRLQATNTISGRYGDWKLPPL